MKLNKLDGVNLDSFNKRGLHSDGGNLYLQITGDTAKSWVFRFCINGKRRHMGLGSIYTTPILYAREAAANARWLVKHGIDPIEEDFMGKRTSLPRHERDFYPTPKEAVDPLLPHLLGKMLFDEPCCGAFDLVNHLEAAGHKCVSASDIITGQDVFDIKRTFAEVFITNPPWTWKTLDPLITHLSDMAPTWLLLNADLAHNKRMAPHMARCQRIVSVGRVSWMQNGISGYENCAWYLFNKDHQRQTVFYARAA